MLIFFRISCSHFSIPALFLVVVLRVEASRCGSRHQKSLTLPQTNRGLLWNNNQAARLELVDCLPSYTAYCAPVEETNRSNPRVRAFWNGRRDKGGLEISPPARNKCPYSSNGIFWLCQSEVVRHENVTRGARFIVSFARIYTRALWVEFLLVFRPRLRQGGDIRPKGSNADNYFA